MAYVCEDCGEDWDAPPDDFLHNTPVQPPKVGCDESSKQ